MIRNIAKTLCLAIVAAMAAIAACNDSNVAPPSAGSITGRVTVDSRGLDGVNVSLSNGKMTTTAADGTFRFDGVATGTYEVSISGYPAHAVFGATSMSATIGTRAGLATVVFSASNSDRDALVALYNATDGPNWTNNTNWLSDAPLDDWYGVTTDAAGRVVRLNLSGYWDSDTGEAVRHGLKGPIPGEVGKLTELTHLLLTWNELTSIPPELGNLGRLQELWLRFNKLSVPIPPELGKLDSLRILDLGYTGVTGPIPPEIGGLSNLRYLYLNDTNLSDPLPLSLEGLPLASLWYYNTGICVPLDASFRAWLGSIEDHQGTGVDCGSTAVAVCDRTPQVRDAIVDATGRSRCDEVTDDDLADVLVLDLAGPQKIFVVADECEAGMKWKTERICEPRQDEALADKQTAGTANAPEIHALLDHDFEGLSGLQELYLQDNWLVELPERVFDPLTSLHTLDLRRNLLISLPAGVFDNLSSLEWISARGNRLTALPDGIFDGTPALGWVEFSSNELAALPDGILDGLVNLRRAYFSRNQLTRLPDGVFDGLSALQQVYFGGNRLTALPDGVLGGLTNLRTVAFNANELTGLPDGIFGGLSALQEVHLGGNGLTALPGDLFRDQADLREVNLAFNELEVLPAGLLDQQSELQRVSFWSNRLKELPGDALRGLAKLEWVDFDDNRLTELPDGLFDGLSSLSFAFFAGNPGSPFTLTPVPERRDDSNPLAPGPATVQLTLAEAAPFNMSVSVKGVGGASLSEGTLRFNVGDTRSSTITVEVAQAPAAVVVDVPPASPQCDRCRFDGLEVGTGASIVLANPPEATVKIAGAYLTQAAQNLEGSVPLVANRDALLRVFATSDAINSFDFEGTADFYQGGSYSGTVHLDPPADGIPLEIEEGRLGASFNGRVPDRFLGPGTEMVVVVRPTFPGVGVNLTDESELRFPAAGRLELDVRDVAPLDVMVVPIQYAWEGNARTNGIVAEFTRDLAERDSEDQLQYTERFLPIPSLNVTAREPYYTHADTTDEGGLAILNEVQLLRHLEAGGTDQYYHGLLAWPKLFSRDGWGFGGIAANIPAYTALTISHWSDGEFRGNRFGETFAHELGHDVSLRHAPGCRAGGPDWNYPHEDAVIGVWGYDVSAPELGLKSPTDFYDYMSYCDPTWVSDYYFTKSLEYLSRPGRASAMASRAPVRKTLVLWGSALDDGDLRLEPPLALDAPVKLPGGTGPYRISGYDEGGRVLFSFDFTPDPTDHSGDVFVFAIPFEDAWANALDRVTLGGPGGSTTMDGRAIDEAAVLVDRSTGRVRSIVREWTGALPPALATDAGLAVLRLRGVN